MLLKELRKAGTYVGVKLSTESMDALEKLLDGIPNPISRSKMHVTIIYSKKPTTFTKADCNGKLDPSWKLVPDEFHVFHTEEGWRALVLKVMSPELEARHKEIMDNYGASYDHDKYTPHVTLSYNIGDFDIAKMGKVGDMEELEAVEEYEQPLDLDFLETKNKGRRDNDTNKK
jgi:2'-5' RNA ligase